MDLRLLLGVLWQRKFLLTLGILVAIAAAILTTNRITRTALVPRTQVSQRATALLLVSTFPEDRTLVLNDQGGFVRGPSAADLTDLYAFFALRESVLSEVETSLGVARQDYRITAFRRNVPPGESSGIFRTTNTPILQIDVVGVTATKAKEVAVAVGRTLIKDTIRRQDKQSVPPDQRVRISFLDDRKLAEVTSIKGRDAQLQIAVFLGVLMAFISLAFIGSGLGDAPVNGAAIRSDERPALDPGPVQWPTADSPPTEDVAPVKRKRNPPKKSSPAASAEGTVELGQESSNEAPQGTDQLGD